MKQTPRQTTPMPWQTPIGLIMLALALYILIYYSDLILLINFWLESSDYSHGLLIPLISAYLIWMKRDALSKAKATPQPWGILFLFLTALGWFIAKTIDVQAIERIALISFLPTIIWTLLGNRATRIILFPLAFLFLASPIFDIFAAPLQNITALVSANILRIIGIPILLEEHYISIPSGMFLIEKACGGLRFFIATSAVSSLYAYLNYKTFSRQIMFVLVALSVTIILNWTRVCIIIVVGHLTEMEHSLVRDHADFGWWLFAGGMFPVFYYGSKVTEQNIVNLPQKETILYKNNLTSVPFIFLSILTFSFAPMIYKYSDAIKQQSEAISITVPSPLPPWRSVHNSSGEWTPKFIGATSHVNSANILNNKTVYLHIFDYSKQKQGAELINELNALYNIDYWRETDNNIRQVEIHNGATLEINEILLESNNLDKRAIWFWYRVASNDTTIPVYAKLLELRKLISADKNSAIIAMAVDYEESLDNPEIILSRFVYDIYESIENDLYSKE